MSKAVMQLETLTCATCIKKIQGALDKTDGVEKTKVLFNASKAKVDFDESKISAEEIQGSIEKLGYEVKGIKVS